MLALACLSLLLLLLLLLLHLLNLHFRVLHAKHEHPLLFSHLLKQPELLEDDLLLEIAHPVLLLQIRRHLLSDSLLRPVE